MVKVFIEGYGCSSNMADSEIMAGLLKQSGFEIVDSTKNSDLNIICTYNVKLPTSQNYDSFKYNLCIIFNLEKFRSRLNRRCLKLKNYCKSKL